MLSPSADSKTHVPQRSQCFPPALFCLTYSNRYHRLFLILAQNYGDFLFCAFRVFMSFLGREIRSLRSFKFPESGSAHLWRCKHPVFSVYNPLPTLSAPLHPALYFCSLPPTAIRNFPRVLQQSRPDSALWLDNNPFRATFTQLGSYMFI